MSGISMVLNTAKQAIAAQQVGLNVTGHNIANVHTDNFSRQTAVQVTQQPMNFQGLNMGAGVDVDTIIRSTDLLLENRLTEQKSILHSFAEAETYIGVLENVFDEAGEDGLSSEIAAFWNTWHDLSNMPSGASERLAVFDTGVRFSELFQSLNSDIRNLETNTSKELDSGVAQINTITAQIAIMNLEVVANSGQGTPNDQLDSRNELVQQLAELIDINTFEQPNGAVNISTKSGHTLVYQNDTFSLTMSTGQVLWEGSMGSRVDITDKISGGKMAGWLKMRDEVFPKYRQDLNTMAEEFVWSMNLQHSQGVGNDLFDAAVTGTYGTDGSQMLSTLAFGDRIDYTGDFRMWVHDLNTAPPTATSVTVDMALATAGPDYAAAGTSFTTANTAYTITADAAGTVGTDAVAFTWQETGGGSGAGTMNAGDTFLTLSDGSRLDLSAGDLVGGSTLTVNTVAGGAPSALSLGITSTANSVLDTYTFRATTGGTVGGTIELEWRNSVTSGTVSLDAATTTATVDGMTLNFAAGTLATDEVFSITTDRAGNATLATAPDWHWSLSSFRDAFNNAADVATGGVAGDGSRYVAASISATNALVFTPRASDYHFAFSDDGSDGFVDSGLTAALGINTFFEGDNAGNIAMNTILNNKDLIAVAQMVGTTGDYGVGDNRNAIAITDIQYQARDMAEWVFVRGEDASSSVMNATMEGYYQAMIGSMGIEGNSIRRDADFNEVLTSRLSEQRDSISGVNLDEEMINLMRYQQAFAVASKLLSVADEMMSTLIATK